MPHVNYRRSKFNGYLGTIAAADMAAPVARVRRPPNVARLIDLGFSPSLAAALDQSGAGTRVIARRDTGAPR